MSVLRVYYTLVEPKSLVPIFVNWHPKVYLKSIKTTLLYVSKYIDKRERRYQTIKQQHKQ